MIPFMTLGAVEEFLIEIHELFCKEYGFIDPQMFYDLPAPMVFNFLEIIKKRNKEMMRHASNSR